jgi:hypothetical protein
MARGDSGRTQPERPQLSWRLYRLCLAPVLVSLLTAAFAFSSPPPPLSSSLSPEAFEGIRAFAQLRHMTAIASSRRPGSVGDRRLQEYIEDQLQALGSPGSGGYALRTITANDQTAWGQRRQTLLIGSRAGSGLQSPIALIADRDSALNGDQAQLSGAAALLELATVLAQTETRHPVYVIFSDGGSGGGLQAADSLRSEVGGRLDAAIVLGDLAGSSTRAPLVQPFSSGLGGAPEVLFSTVSSALQSQLKRDPGAPGLASQLAHLAFPLVLGEQGQLNGVGIPSVAVSLAGERGAAADEPVTQARLQATGRAALSAFYALDHGPEVAASPSTSLQLSGHVVPAWSIALLSLSLLIGPLALACDAIARSIRAGNRVSRWVLLAITCGWPLLLCAACIKALAAIGILHAASNPVPAAALVFDVGSLATLFVLVALLAISLRWWKRLAWGNAYLGQMRSSGAAGVAALGSSCIFALLIWALDPYTALLLVPALHLWPLALSPRPAPKGRPARLALVLAPALLPLALLVAFYMVSLGLTPGEGVLELLAMIGGGYVNWGGALLWSVAFGLLAAVAFATANKGGALSPSRVRPPSQSQAPVLYRGERPFDRGERPPYRERPFDRGERPPYRERPFDRGERPFDRGERPPYRERTLNRGERPLDRERAPKADDAQVPS